MEQPPATPAPWPDEGTARRLALGGAAVFVAGLVIAMFALHGSGPGSCGTFGLECVVRSFFWLLGSQVVAAALFWFATAGLPPATWPRWLTLAGAVFSTLASLAGLTLIVMVIGR